MSKPQQVEITLGSILKVFGVIFAILLLKQILDIITLLVVVLIFVAALNPIVKWLVKEGIPRAPAVTIIFLAIFSIITILFSLVLTPLVGEVIAFINRLPEFISGFTSSGGNEGIKNIIQNFAEQISSAANTVTAGIFVAVSSIFGGAVSAVLVAVLTFYLLVDAPKNQRVLDQFIPSTYAGKIKTIAIKIGEKIGNWVLGQMVLSFSVSVIVYIGLLLMGVPFSLTLAALAGILEVVPYVGPIVAGIIAVVIAFSSSGWQLALGVLIFYVILQQFQSVFLVPKVMQKALGLSPILIIMAVAIGSKLAGAAGAILAVPILTAVVVIIKEWPRISR